MRGEINFAIWKRHEVQVGEWQELGWTRSQKGHNKSIR